MKDECVRESVSPCVLTRTGLGSGPDSREPVSGRARYELCFPQFWHSPHLSSLEVSTKYCEKFAIFGEGPDYGCLSMIIFALFKDKCPNFRWNIVKTRDISLTPLILIAAPNYPHPHRGGAVLRRTVLTTPLLSEKASAGVFRTLLFSPPSAVRCRGVGELWLIDANF